MKRKTMKQTGIIPERATMLDEGVAWGIIAVPSISNPAFFTLKLVSLSEINGKANWWLRGYCVEDGRAKRAGMVRGRDLAMLKTSRPLLYATVEPRLDSLADGFAAEYKPAPRADDSEVF